jgi:hypothetical protein
MQKVPSVILRQGSPVHGRTGKRYIFAFGRRHLSGLKQSSLKPTRPAMVSVWAQIRETDMKSAAIIILCLLGLTACESTTPKTAGDFGSPGAFKGDLNNLGGDTAMPQSSPAQN